MNEKYFLYNFTCEEGEEEIAKTIFALMFPLKEYSKFVISKENYHLDSCVFLNFKIEIVISTNKYSEFLALIKTLNYDNWHLNPWHFYKEFDYKKRMTITKELANNLNNLGVIKNADIELIWAFYQDTWLFGEITYNPYTYKQRIHKPHQYSYALPVRLCHQAIQLINILIPDGDIIDPCCGVGTLVIEGLTAKRNISGYEINTLIAQKAQENLDFFKLANTIYNQDMLITNKHFTISCLDIPYGLYTPTSLTLQMALINKCYEISDYLVLISTEEFTYYPKQLNYQPLLKTYIKKGNLKRWLTFWKV